MFSAGGVFVLTWLHWFVLVGTGVAGMLMVAMVWADLRWYHVVGSPEIDGLRDRAMAMPIPADWSLDEAGERNDGSPRTLRVRAVLRRPADLRVRADGRLAVLPGVGDILRCLA